MIYPVISKFFNINRPSLALVILAWLAFNFNSTFLSSPVTINELLLFFLSLLILEIIFAFIPNENLKLFVIINAFIFLFGFLFIHFLNNFINSLFNIEIRLRIYFIILFIVINFLVIVYIKIKKYKFLNIFLVVFFLFNLVNNATIYLSSEKKHYYYFNPKKVYFDASEKNKPILFLVLDEYHSPDDLYRKVKDTSIYNFSNFLKQNNWQTKTNFQSNEIWTIRSLSSLFNYNLSCDSNFIKADQLIPDYLFAENYLSLDLRKKGIKLKNWGWYNFGLTRSLNINESKIDMPFSILKNATQNTTLAYIWNNTNKLALEGFKNNYFVISEYNTSILNRLRDSIPLIKEKSFVYAHLAMPHPPFYHHSPQFSLEEINLENYIEYWKFTNKLVSNQLGRITQSQNIKIIITGDHGFRGDSRIDKNKTFLALYGFDCININEIKTVQDLGSLINSNF
jgi:hypothetical protein